MNMGKNKIIKTNFLKKSYGRERRENLTKENLYKGTPFPKTVTYKDIDRAFKEWVKNDVKIIYDGVELPTMTLLTTQRFSEYSQTWEYNDDKGGILLNFKTITRENNPKKGTSQGEYFNIPGQPMWAMFYSEVLEDNGTSGYNMYKIKQPVSIDLNYSVSIICNKFELLNEMNNKIQELFKSLQCYIRVNGHFMPLILENINDNSEYNLENRRFYVQTYDIKCLGYIIQESDFEVERIPNKTIITFENDGVERPTATLSPIEDHSNFDDERVKITMNFNVGVKDKISFRIDEDLFIHDCDMFNICNLEITRFGDDYILDPKKGFTLRKHEKITVKIKRKYRGEEAIVELHGKNPYFNYYDELPFIQNKDEEISGVVYKEEKEKYLDKGRHTQEIIESI